MGAETVSLVIAAFVNGSLGIAALLRNFRSRQCVSFAALMGAFFAHDALTVYERFDTSGLLSGSAWHLLAIFLAGPATIWFLSEIIPVFHQKLNRYLWAYVPLTLLLIGLMALPTYRFFAPFVFVVGHLFYLYAAGIWLAGLYYAGKTASLTRERLRLRFAFVGALVTVAFYATDVMYLFDARVYPLGTLVREIYFFYLFQTFIQKELMTAEEVVAKVALFGGIALMLSIIYALLVSWVGSQKNLFFFNTLIASFVIIVLFEPIRHFSNWSTRKLLLRRHTMLEDELNTLILNLMGVVEPADLSRRIGASLRRILGTEKCSLFVLDREGLGYVRIDSLGSAHFDEEYFSLGPLVEYMGLRRGRPFILETIENDRDSFRSAQARKFCQDCLDGMRELEADFVIPFVYDARVVGFCTVKTGERMILSNEQLRLFGPLCRQIALQLKNAQVFTTLRERDKLAAAGEMAAGLAHEIKNPLGAIKGAAQLLSAELRDPDPRKTEYLNIIQDETNRLSVVLTEFLDYAKPGNYNPQTQCDPVKVVEHTVTLVRKDSSNVNIDLEMGSKALTIEADPDMLKQVLLNLLINAIQSMAGISEQPHIRVRLREIWPRTLIPFADRLPIHKKWEGWEMLKVPRRSFVEIEVSDNGCGIRPEDVDRIFTPFFTTKPKGTGLGLAICQRLVENMGGTIAVKSNRPRGAVFTIHLPLSREERVPEMREKAKPKELTV